MAIMTVMATVMMSPLLESRVVLVVMVNQNDLQHLFPRQLARHEATLAAVLGVVVVATVTVLDDPSAVGEEWAVVTSRPVHICHDINQLQSGQESTMLTFYLDGSGHC